MGVRERLVKKRRGKRGVGPAEVVVATGGGGEEEVGMVEEGRGEE